MSRGDRGSIGTTSLARRGFLTAAALAGSAIAVGPASATASVPRPQTSSRQGGGVRVGAQVSAEAGWRELAGHRVGILTNPTGVLPELTHVVDAVVADGSVDLVAAFGPEHGFRGTAQAGGSEGDYTDPRTGVPVYDIYGSTADEIAAMYRQAGVDLVVFDIADVGARFYTYIWAMYTAMHAAAIADIGFLVLDRPNPLGGASAGPQLDPAFSSGVGRKPIVAQHGMTVGELARLFDAEFLPEDAGRGVAELQIVQTQGWERSQLFGATGLPWVPPSPNVPTADTAHVYPGTCLFEGTVFSEGRGTTRPFETIGAPGVDWRWAERLNEAALPGVRFRETYFVPSFGKHEGADCGGVQLHVTSTADFEPLRTGLWMLATARELYPEQWGWRPDHFIDLLAGSDRLRTMLDAGASPQEINDSWTPELEAFRVRREPYLLYR
ncbi:exo-beta-N-acetylmuramidase NamZ family protein [Actinoalloteichus hymeniacidonis]|uniref:DUF1343 domain-containing protein n=1 Tax=Actinoalloteichus hymeniacidonis TaxID=340345 RepID=A0AAC9MWT1_9PSEU|nr:DUF1343 domain-containing protein [Actinoalloteichus hymeniacidonis]AOS61127.1 hypothetical protein TL08_01430 [Actinoalloteichus hymeniacidonis]MBB5910872.1 uncharacterized protein YbbC (DUF1343 family) [Actinoalloteichus hymeniacidonis]